MSTRILVGDARKRLRELESESTGWWEKRRLLFDRVRKNLIGT